MRTLLVWLSVLGVATAQQLPLTTTSIKLVDFLGLPQHALLLAAFQRARLIPILNMLNGSTLLAPSDDAIRRASESSALWAFATRPDSPPPHDNLQLELRDVLLYHLINSTQLGPNATAIPTVQPKTLETLYYPSLSSLNTSFPSPPTLPGSPPDDPTPDEPSAPEGLLRGHGQRLRIVRDKMTDEVWVGGDWQGEGGVKVVNGSLMEASNGVFVVIEAIIQRPVDMAQQIRTNPDLSVLASLLPVEILNYLSTAAHVTFIAPTNFAWTALSALEMRYLRSSFAETDLSEIFGSEASTKGTGGGEVGYLDTLLKKGSSSVSTILGQSLEVSSKDGRPVVNGTVIDTGDILAMNGVIHTVPSLLLPAGSLALTAEKYLIALNATRFVALLRSVNLSHYVQLPAHDSLLSPSPVPYTILAPRDDVFDTDSNGVTHMRTLAGWNALPPMGSDALREILEYHILAGRWKVDQLKDGMLLGTELRGSLRKGARQMLPVSVSVGRNPKDGFSGWGKKGDGDKSDTIVGFGGASVVGETLQVGDSIIYLLASILEPPGPLITTAVGDLRLSTFVASVYAARLDRILSRTPSITYLVPSNKAFATLNLVMSYLLLPSSRNELSSLLKYHAIDEIDYLADFAPRGGSGRFPTLDGAEIYVERSSTNGSLAIHGPTIGGEPANGESRSAKVLDGDVLLSSGVLHVVDQVILPPNLAIGIEKLMKGAKASTFGELLRTANMSWVLEGSAMPSAFWGDVESSKHRKRREKERNLGSAYTVLCPTDKALSRLNLTYYLSDALALRSLLLLHIIPSPLAPPLNTHGIPLDLVDESVYPTLLDVSQGGHSQFGQLAFRKWGAEGFLVGIKNARGTEGELDSARVLSWGRSTPTILPNLHSPRLSSGGGLILLDSVLLPYEESWFRRVGWKLVAAGIVISSLALIGYLTMKLWARSKVQTYDLLEGEED